MVDVVSIVSGIFGGLGLGSLITTIIKDNMERKNFLYQEKLKSYYGLIEALRDLQIEENQKNKQNVVNWHQRIKLIGSNEVDELIEKFYITNNQDYLLIREKVLAAMKKDLYK